jgi:hypothetical protein
MADCSSCRFSRVDYMEGEGYDDGPLMRCHRYPPQIFVVDGDPAQTWPNIGPDDWCGEHQEETRKADTTMMTRWFIGKYGALQWARDPAGGSTANPAAVFSRAFPEAETRVAYESLRSDVRKARRYDQAVQVAHRLRRMRDELPSEFDELFDLLTEDVQ